MKKNGATYTTTLSLYTAFSDIAAWIGGKGRFSGAQGSVPSSVGFLTLTAEG